MSLARLAGVGPSRSVGHGSSSLWKATMQMILLTWWISDELHCVWLKEEPWEMTKLCPGAVQRWWNCSVGELTFVHFIWISELTWGWSHTHSGCGVGTSGPNSTCTRTAPCNDASPTVEVWAVHSVAATRGQRVDRTTWVWPDLFSLTSRYKDRVYSFRAAK